MAQVLFATDTTPSLVDLDANHTELYSKTAPFTCTATRVGVATTPVAWGSSRIPIELGGSTDFGYIQSQNSINIHQNNYFDGSNFRAIKTLAGGAYQIDSGVHRWFTAASVTAGSVATLVQNLVLDASGNFLNTGPGAIGYGTGAGATVTQLTSKSTGVTLNKNCGVITMNNAALGAGASATFILSNTGIAITDCFYANAAANQNYRVEVATVATGQAYIRVTNVTAGSLSDALVINFVVVKAVSA